MTETSAQNGPLSSWCQNPEFSYFRLAVKEEQRLHELNLLLQGIAKECPVPAEIREAAELKNKEIWERIRNKDFPSGYPEFTIENSFYVHRWNAGSHFAFGSLGDEAQVAYTPLEYAWVATYFEALKAGSTALNAKKSHPIDNYLTFFDRQIGSASLGLGQGAAFVYFLAESANRLQDKTEPHFVCLATMVLVDQLMSRQLGLKLIDGVMPHPFSGSDPTGKHKETGNPLFRYDGKNISYMGSVYSAKRV
jgi:hypothetical protein